MVAIAPDEEGLYNHALVSTPEAITRRLKALQQEIGLCGILAELNCGGLIPHEQVLRAMQLLCEEVKRSRTSSKASIS